MARARVRTGIPTDGKRKRLKLSKKLAGKSERLGVLMEARLVREFFAERLGEKDVARMRKLMADSLRQRRKADKMVKAMEEKAGLEFEDFPEHYRGVLDKGGVSLDEKLAFARETRAMLKEVKGHWAKALALSEFLFEKGRQAGLREENLDAYRKEKEFNKRWAEAMGEAMDAVAMDIRHLKYLKRGKRKE